MKRQRKVVCNKCGDVFEYGASVQAAYRSSSGYTIAGHCPKCGSDDTSRLCDGVECYGAVQHDYIHMGRYLHLCDKHHEQLEVSACNV